MGAEYIHVDKMTDEETKALTILHTMLLNFVIGINTYLANK